MTMPAGVTLVTVSGTLLNADGTPATGWVSFTPAAAVEHVAATVDILPSTVNVPITSGGVFTVNLPATDDAGGNPTGWTYAVVERVVGGRGFSMQLLAANGSTQRYETLVPIASSLGTAVVVGPAGPSGDAGRTFTGTGDGITDDHAALQALLDAHVGTTITLRGGIGLSTAIVAQGGHTIRGESATLTLLNGSAASAVIASTAAVSTGTGVILDGPIVIDGRDGLTIDGNWLNTTGLGHGILLASGGEYEASARRTKVQNVSIRNCRGDGIRLTDTNLGGHTIVVGNGAWLGLEPRITGCQVAQVYGHGINVTSTQDLFTDGFLTNNLLGYIGIDGMRVNCAAGWRIEGNHGFGIGGSGILVVGAYATRITDNYLEGVGLWTTADETSRNPVFRAAPNWASGTTFAYNQVSVYNGALFVSKADANTGNTPTSSPTWWDYYDTTASVGAYMLLSGAAGRGSMLTGNYGSLGHNSWVLDSRLYYRGVYAEGYNSAGSVHVMHLTGNEMSNENQPAGANTVAYRYVGKTGGLQIHPTANVAGGSWTTVAQGDTSTTTVITDAATP